MEIQFNDSIHNIDPQQWNTLTGIDYPFLRHEFFQALEDSRCTHNNTGWLPQHLTIKDNGQLIAALPLYLKNNSYGEYVFDWAWADAYRHYGLRYYPKLITCIPFTPATGPRIALHPQQNADALMHIVMTAIEQRAKQVNASSWHCLFPAEHNKQQLQQQSETHSLMLRTGVQYHWHNKNYQHFDDFLKSFSSRKRKNLKKERKAVIEQSISFDVFEGNNINPELWDTFYNFYHATHQKKFNQMYLNQEFFQQIHDTLPEHLVLILAKKQQQYIAGALCFKSDTTLYGRYWGSLGDYNFLHFETCYYQGIEYCIKHQLQHFDPGAQGEHKIQRGFEPTPTYSYHWIENPGFGTAIEDFVQREEVHVENYIEDASEHLPFKK